MLALLDGRDPERMFAMKICYYGPGLAVFDDVRVRKTRRIFSHLYSGPVAGFPSLAGLGGATSTR